MDRGEVLKVLEGIFRDVFDDDSIIITEDTKSEDIEDWDSIGHVYLTVEIEEEFGISLEERMAKIGNVKDMIDIILEVL